MFGLDFAGLSEAIPKMQEFGDKISKDFAALVEEQKAQRALLKRIAQKLEINPEGEEIQKRIEKAIQADYYQE